MGHVRAPLFAASIAGLRRRSTLYGLPHGLVDNAGYLSCLADVLPVEPRAGRTAAPDDPRRAGS